MTPEPTDSEMREFHRVWIGDRHAWLLSYDALPDDHKKRLSEALRHVLEARGNRGLTAVEAAVSAACGGIIGSLVVLIIKGIMG